MHTNAILIQFKKYNETFEATQNSTIYSGHTVFLSQKSWVQNLSTGPGGNILVTQMIWRGFEIVHPLSALSKVVPSEKMAKIIWPIDVASIEYNALLESILYLAITMVKYRKNDAII